MSRQRKPKKHTHFNFSRNSWAAVDPWKWIDGVKEKNNRFWTDDDVIGEVMAEEENDGGNTDDEKGTKASSCSYNNSHHRDRIRIPLLASITRAKENGARCKRYFSVQTTMEKRVKSIISHREKNW